MIPVIRMSLRLFKVKFKTFLSCFGLPLLMVISGCVSNSDQIQVNEKLLFTPAKSGITFKNSVQENSKDNYYTYEYFYNGAGIGVGDFNKDGLEDLFFAGNQVKDELYINKGDLKFEKLKNDFDHNEEDGWSTGVTVVDINGDSLDDIYICRAGPYDAKERENLLYINQGNLRFKEQAKKYGLNDNGYSTHALFFDYDRDGNLDCYVVNHPVQNSLIVQVKYEELIAEGKIIPDRLYKGTESKFLDVSKFSGTQNYGFGLGVALCDLNQDKWLDIYVANDFTEPDRLYVNQKNGTFKDEFHNYFKHGSQAAMGVDIADVNKDGLEDVFVVDMAFPSHLRSKKNMFSMDAELFNFFVEEGKGYQYNHNTLQINQGNNKYSDQAYLYGVAKSDWSWAPLIEDFNNDLNQDIFITNGIKRNVLDNDYQLKMVELLENEKVLTFESAFKNMPYTISPNLFFKGSESGKFKEDKTLFKKSYNANGAVYGDFDKDGDLDLVVHHMDSTSVVYRNSKNSGSYIIFSPDQKGRQNFGTTIQVFAGGRSFVKRYAPVRGFMSSVSPEVYFGLADIKKVDSVIVQYKDYKSLILNPEINTRHSFGIHENIEKEIQLANSTKKLFTKTEFGLFEHIDNNFDDFAREVLLPWKQSQVGPQIEVFDFNSDGLEDIYFSSSNGNYDKVLTQESDGTFKEQLFSDDLKLRNTEISAVLNSTNKLYLFTGGNERPASSTSIRYGVFNKMNQFLDWFEIPSLNVSTSTFIESGEFIFLGGGTVPAAYPKATNSLLLKADDSGGIKVVSKYNTGLIRSSVATDWDEDGDEDILFVEEWGKLNLILNEGSEFSQPIPLFDQKNGLWQSIICADFNNDRIKDLFVGNVGLNSKYKASNENPLLLYSEDFDKNGQQDIILASKEAETLYPIRGKECSSEQMPELKEKFKDFNSFASASLDEIYGKAALEKAALYSATNLSHTLYLSKDGNHQEIKLPFELQSAPINVGLVEDINSDGNPDLILAGNKYGTEVETTRMDGSFGFICLGDGKGNFELLAPYESGLYIEGECKSLKWIDIQNERYLVAAVNNGPLQFFKWNKDGFK